MTDLGWTPYPLPSRGVLYLKDPDSPESGSKLPGGKVEIRPFRGREQALLQTQGGGIVGKLDAIIKTCTKFPDGFTSKDLLLTDRFAILLAQRTKTFGPIYQFQVRCESCKTQFQHTVDIVNDFSEVPGTDELVEPFPVPLPESGITVHLRFLRGHDDEQIAKNAKRIKLQSNDDHDPTYLLRIAMQIVRIETEEGDEDTERLKQLPWKQKWVENMSAGDLIALEDALNDKEPGIDTRIYPECGRCGHTSEQTMPLDGGFFRPRRRTRSPNA